MISPPRSVRRAKSGNYPLAFDGAAIKISQALVLFAISFYNEGREKGLTGTRHARHPAGLGQIPASKDEAVGNAGESVVP